MQCSNIGRRKDADERNKFVCENCGKEEHRARKEQSGGRIYREQKYCSYECKVDAQKKKALRKFESGGYKKHTKQHGYVWITVPELARASTGKRSIMEHRWIMMQHIGRDLLPEETVHHINGIRSDNRIENLELFNSRHGPGQRVVDKVDFAIEILTTYPAFAKAAGGWKNLVEIVHLSDALP